MILPKYKHYLRAWKFVFFQGCHEQWKTAISNKVRLRIAPFKFKPFKLSHYAYVFGARESRDWTSLAVETDVILSDILIIRVLLVLVAPLSFLCACPRPRVIMRHRCT